VAGLDHSTKAKAGKTLQDQRPKQGNILNNLAQDRTNREIK